jgi:hypothetical protein
MDLEATGDTGRVDQAFHDLLLTLNADTPPLPTWTQATCTQRADGVC